MFRWLQSLGVAIVLAAAVGITALVLMAQLMSGSDSLRRDVGRVLRAFELPMYDSGAVVLIDDGPSVCCDEFYDGGRLVLAGVVLGGIPMAMFALILTRRATWVAAIERWSGWESLLRACVVFQLSNFLLASVALLTLWDELRVTGVGVFLVNVCTSLLALPFWRNLHASVRGRATRAAQSAGGPV